MGKGQRNEIMPRTRLVVFGLTEHQIFKIIQAGLPIIIVSRKLIIWCSQVISLGNSIIEVDMWPTWTNQDMEWLEDLQLIM